MSRWAVIKALVLNCMIFLMIPFVHGGEKPTVIKIATLAPDGSAWTDALSALDKVLMEKSHQRLKLKIYPGGVLGDEKDMIRKMHINQIQAAVLTSPGLSAIFSEMDIFQVPFLLETYEEADYIIAKMDGFFKNGLKENGYILLGWTEGGFVRLMSTQPIYSLSDLQKMKVWTWEDASVAEAVFKQARIAAIPLSVPDVLVGLQTGLVDVVYAPPAVAISLQWFTRVKYMTDVPLIYLVGAVVMKKKAFEGIPTDLQDLLLTQFQIHLMTLKEILRSQNQEAIKVMEKHGVTVVKPSRENVEEFKQVSNQAIQHISGKTFSKAVFEEATQHLAAFRGERP